MPLPAHRLCKLALCLAAATAAGAPARGELPPGDRIIPADAFLLAEIPNVDRLVERFEKTGLYGLYKDPAMQRFLVPLEKKVRELIDRKIKEAWERAGAQGPAKSLLHRPTGRVVVGLRLRTKVVQMPKFGLVEGEWKIQGTRDQKTPHIQAVVLADMGKSAAPLREAVDKLTAAAVEKGWRRKKISVRGVEIVTLTAPPPEKDANPRPGRRTPEQDRFCYAFTGDIAIGGTDLELVKDVLVRMRGGDLPPFGADAGYREAFKALGGDPDLRVYLRAKVMLSFFKSMAPEEKREQAEAQIHALGLDTIEGAALTVTVSPNPRQDARIRMRMGIRGARRGLPALLTPLSRSTKPGALLTAGMAGFLVAQYDLGAIYDEVARLAREMAGVDLNQQVQGFLKATAVAGEQETPPVDLRKDVLGQLTPPLTLTANLTKPYTASEAPKMTFAIGVRDAAALDAALGRIHNAFFGGGENKLRKELLKTNIYLLPGGSALMSAFLMGGMGGDEPAPKLALSVVGENLLVADVDGVEQSVRSLRRGKGRQSIQLDPMYRHVAKFLPAQAGLYFYGNDRMSAEQTWAQLKEAAKAPTTAPAAASATSLATVLRLIQQEPTLGNALDLGALPAFDAVKQYFGASIGHLQDTDAGLLMEFVVCKPPKP